jgi:hypothetical protein
MSKTFFSSRFLHECGSSRHWLFIDNIFSEMNDEIRNQLIVNDESGETSEVQRNEVFRNLEEAQAVSEEVGFLLSR